MRAASGSAVARWCAVCERSLLLGEQATRYSPADGEWVDVCALCRTPALERGWLKEGAPSSPIVGLERRRLRFPRRGRRDGAGGDSEPPPLVTDDAARVDYFAAACEMFNASAFRRTVSGVAKSLGTPWASLVYLTGAKPEVVITVAWELSWYQYRVVLADSAAIRLVERGYELDELDARFTTANATFDSEMVLSPLAGEASTASAGTATT